MITSMTLQGMLFGFRYKPGWRAWLTQDGGVLHVCAWVPDSAQPGDTPLEQVREIPVEHTFLVPPGLAGLAECRRWLLEACLLVERHEAMEWFEVAGHRPFYPGHGPGADLYGIEDKTGKDHGG